MSQYAQKISGYDTVVLYDIRGIVETILQNWVKAVHQNWVKAISLSFYTSNLSDCIQIETQTL